MSVASETVLPAQLDEPILEAQPQQQQQQQEQVQKEEKQQEQQEQQEPHHSCDMVKGGGSDNSNSSRKLEQKRKEAFDEAAEAGGRRKEKRGPRPATTQRHVHVPPPSPLLTFTPQSTQAPLLRLLPLDTSADACEGAGFMVGHCADVAGRGRKSASCHDRKKRSSNNDKSASPSKKERGVHDGHKKRQLLGPCAGHEHCHFAKKRNIHHKGRHHASHTGRGVEDSKTDAIQEVLPTSPASLDCLPDEVLTNIVQCILEDHRTITLGSVSSSLRYLLHQPSIWSGAEVFIPPWSLKDFAPQLHKWQSIWAAARKMVVPASTQLLAALGSSTSKLPYEIAWRFDKYVMGEGIEVLNHGTTIKRIAGEMVVALGDAPLVADDNAYAYLEVRIDAMDEGPGGDGINDFGIGITPSDEMFELGAVAAEIPGAWVVDFTTSAVCLSVDNMEESRGTGASSRGLRVGDVVGIGFALSPPTSRRGPQAAPPTQRGATNRTAATAADSTAVALPTASAATFAAVPSASTTSTDAPPNRRETQSEGTVVEIFINGVLRDRLRPRSNSRLTRASRFLPVFDLFGRVSQLSRSYGKGPGPSC